MILHTSLAYLQKMESQTSVDFFDEEKTRQAKTQMQWFDLVVKGIKVIELDATDEEIENCAQPLIRHLIRHGRLRPKGKHGRFISPFHLYASMENAKDSIRLQKQSGTFYISHTSNKEDVFGQYLHHFDVKELNTWQFATPAFTPHNSIVVADPYLYTNHGLEGFLAMMRCVVSKQLKSKYHVALIGKPYNERLAPNILQENEVDVYFNELILFLKSYGLDVVFERFYCTQNKFHDRYIFTNNAIIFLGSGVSVLARDNGTPHKEGTWIAVRPFSRLSEHGRQGIFMSELIEKKLSVFKFWLSQAGYTSISNPLLT